MNEKRFPSQSAERIIVRLPDGMRDELAAVAKANGRSVNAEVVLRLSLTLTEVGNDMNAFGMGALVKRLEAHAEATEAVARRLIHELYLANGVGLEDDPQITEAVDAWIESRPDKPVRPQAIRTILADWLVTHGFMARDHKPKHSGPATDAVQAMDAAIGKDRKRKRSRAAPTPSARL